MSTVYRYLAGAGIALAALVVVGLVAHHKGYVSGQAETEAAVQAQVTQAQINAQKLGDTILANKAKSDAEIAKLKEAIASFKPQEKIIYVPKRIVVQGKTVYVPQPYSGSVYLTRGFVSLFNRSLQSVLPGPTSGAPSGASTAPSAVAVSDLESASLSNNVACYANNAQLRALIAWVKGVSGANTK